ncbi:YjbF family lipoprotein [Litorivita pollutaquae]|nr:YjbF family lipoprotein [Litorivita pollutaquae]
MITKYGVWVVVAAAGLMLASCGNSPTRTDANKKLAVGVLQSVGLGPKAPPAPSEAQQIAGAMVEKTGDLRMVRIPQRDVAAAIYPVQRNQGVRLWASADQRGFYFRDGMLVATRGLGGDLMQAEVRQSLAHVTSRRSGRALRVHRYLTGDNQPDLRRVNCRITPMGQEAVRYAAMSAQTVKMRETCEGGETRFENVYWVSASGKIVRSVQWQGDMGGMIEFIDIRN